MASAKPATAPDASRVGASDTAKTVPEVPSEIATSPSCSPRPSAAAMLSPVPGPTTASPHVPATRRRAEHRRRDRADRARRARARRRRSRRRRRPVAGARRVAAIGDELAGELQGQPVVGEQHVRDAGEHLGLVLAQPRELGDRERRDGHAADGVGPAVGAPARRRARRPAAPTRCRSRASPGAARGGRRRARPCRAAGRRREIAATSRPCSSSNDESASHHACGSCSLRGGTVGGWGGARCGRARRCRRRAPRPCTLRWRSRRRRRAAISARRGAAR